MLAIMLVWLAFPQCFAAPQRNVAVFYPEVSGGYAALFKSLVSGIYDYPGLAVRAFPVQKDTTQAELSTWLGERPAQAIIALGKRSYDAVKQLDTPLPILTGAFLQPPKGNAGVSLHIDAELAISKLKKMIPDIRRILMVHGNSGNWAPSEQIAETTVRHTLKFLELQGDSAQTVLKHYQTLFLTAKGKRDILWLPVDRTTPWKVILPDILEHSWRQRFAVFSHNPAHVQRGALLCFFPDNYKVGQQLAELTLGVLNGDNQREIQSSRHFKIAVNVRTARHLGISFSESQQEQFSLVFPAR